MRAVHHCKTCDFRLPYCVRTDRHFCGQRCRVWWYRHPGQQRLDFSPRSWGEPERPGKGQPKTLTEAFRALFEARQYAARLEVAAKAHQLEERRLRAKLSALADEATALQKQETTERGRLRDELEEARRQLALAEEQVRAAAEKTQGIEKHKEEQATLLQQARDDAAKKDADLERARGELAELRKLQAQHDEQHTEAIRVLKSENAELVTLADDLRLQNKELTRACDELRSQADKAQGAAAENRAALDRANNDLSELQSAHAQHAKQHGEEVALLKEKAAALVALREDLVKQKAEITRDYDELRGRVESAERALAQRDDDLSLQRRTLAASERAHQEVHAVAESESRSLRAEKERRIAAEQRVEQLTRDLETLARETGSSSANNSEIMALLFGKQEELLTAELKEVRTHRDEAIAERELLSARILKLMAPGQYLEHAAAAGYDLTKDPLIRLKREEVLVENRLAAWQDAHKKRRRARRLDPEQTLDEQAYAAALAFRWKQINHPHLRRKQQPKWIAVGFLLDGESEKYLLTLTQERIEEMRKRVAAI